MGHHNPGTLCLPQAMLLGRGRAIRLSLKQPLTRLNLEFTHHHNKSHTHHSNLLRTRAQQSIVVGVHQAGKLGRESGTRHS